MPSTITHSFFMKDVYDILPESISKSVDVNRSLMFSQSTDSLMFYNLLSVCPGKSIRKLHHYSHSNNTGDFFINLLNYVRGNSIDDKDVYSFIVGFISHYVLDSTIHPYIIYKTGDFDKKNPSTYKYNNVHHFMETFIDNDMVKRRLHINPYKYKFTKYCFDTRSFSNDLNRTIDNVFYSTYKVKDMSKIYYKSLKQEKVLLNLFRRDTYGIKKFFYKLIDTVTPRRTFRFEALSYHYPLEDKHNFLNTNNNVWRNPAIYDQTSTESFIDLYLKSIKKAKDLICASFEYLDGKDIELEKIFPNISYYTGLECSEDRVLKYFEF